MANKMNLCSRNEEMVTKNALYALDALSAIQIYAVKNKTRVPWLQDKSSLK